MPQSDITLHGSTGSVRIVASFDPRVPDVQISSHDVNHVRRCAASSRYARAAEAREEFETWQGSLRKGG